MTRPITKTPEIMARIAVIRDNEESRYSDVRNWLGEIENWTDSAVLLWFEVEPQPHASKRWLPYSQLRKAEDEQSVYASFWILDKKGL